MPAGPSKFGLKLGRRGHWQGELFLAGLLEGFFFFFASIVGSGDILDAVSFRQTAFLAAWC